MNSAIDPAPPVQHRIEAIRLEDSQHCEALGFLLDTYAAGPTGRGAPLSQQAK